MLIKIAGDLFLPPSSFVNQMFIESTYFIRCMKMTIIKWKSDKFLYRLRSFLFAQCCCCCVHTFYFMLLSSIVLCSLYKLLRDSLFIYFDFEHSIFEWMKSQHTIHNVQNKTIKNVSPKERAYKQLRCESSIHFGCTLCAAAQKYDAYYI